LSRPKDSRNGKLLCCTDVPSPDANRHSHPVGAGFNRKRPPSDATAADICRFSGLRFPVSVAVAACERALRRSCQTRSIAAISLARATPSGKTARSPSKSYWPTLPMKRRDGGLFGALTAYQRSSSDGSRLAHRRALSVQYDFDRYSTFIEAPRSTSHYRGQRFHSPTVHLIKRQAQQTALGRCFQVCPGVPLTRMHGPVCVYASLRRGRGLRRGRWCGSQAPGGIASRITDWTTVHRRSCTRLNCSSDIEIWPDQVRLIGQSGHCLPAACHRSAFFGRRSGCSHALNMVLPGRAHTSAGDICQSAG